jgi:hypothetical protein
VENAKNAFTHTSESVADALDAGARGGSDLLSRTREKFTATVADVNSGMSERLANADVADRARRAVGIAAENPLGLALAALAVGFVVGSALPVLEVERERLKPIGDRIAEQAQAATSDLVTAGKAVAIETAQSAVATALSSAKSHGHEVLDAAKARV